LAIQLVGEEQGLKSRIKPDKNEKHHWCPILGVRIAMVFSVGAPDWIRTSGTWRRSYQAVNKKSPETLGFYPKRTNLPLLVPMPGALETPGSTAIFKFFHSSSQTVVKAQNRCQSI